MTRKQREAEFLALVEQCGLSPSSPEDGWKLAFALFMDRFEAQPLLAKKKRGRGRPPAEDGTLRDLIMLSGVWHARENGDTRSEEEILRDLAKHNGWEDKASTLWRRYQLVKKPGNRYRRNAIMELLRPAPEHSVEN